MTPSAHRPVQALIVVDVQRGFLSGPGAVPAAPAVLHSIGVLLAAARTAGVLVVHLQNDGPPGEPDEPRAAEWALGDEIEIVASAADVAFSRPARGSGKPHSCPAGS